MHHHQSFIFRYFLSPPFRKSKTTNGKQHCLHFYGVVVQCILVDTKKKKVAQLRQQSIRTFKCVVRINYDQFICQNIVYPMKRTDHKDASAIFRFSNNKVKLLSRLIKNASFVQMSVSLPTICLLVFEYIQACVHTCFGITEKHCCNFSAVA